MSAPDIPPPPPPSPGLSSTMITGIVLVAMAALVLATTLLYVLSRRCRGGDAINLDKEQAPRMLQVEENNARTDLHLMTSPNPRLGRSVSRRNLTPSIVLPLPAPPLPTARPRLSVGSSGPAVDSSGRPMSSAEIVAHHQAAGNMPRPFDPYSNPQSPPSYQTPGVRTSTASFSFSRASILPSLRNSTVSSSSLYSSSSSRLGQETLKVRHVFAPLLPDELVLRSNEKLSLIQSFEDGWCIVGRRSPFFAPGLSKPSGYPFGQGVTAEEVEIGAVPSWVFERRENGVKPERPMRTVSLGVTLVDKDIEDKCLGGSGEVRTDVISWSNF